MCPFDVERRGGRQVSTCSSLWSDVRDAREVCDEVGHRSGFRSCWRDQIKAGHASLGTVSLLCKVGVMMMTSQGEAGIPTTQV